MCWGGVTDKKGVYFRGKDEKGFYFKGTKGQILRRTGGQRQYWGTENTRRRILDFWKQGNKPKTSATLIGYLPIFQMLPKTFLRITS